MSAVAHHPGVTSHRRVGAHPTRAALGTLVVGWAAVSGTLIVVGLLVTHLLGSSVGTWDEHVNAWFARHRSGLGNEVSGDFTFAANTAGIVGIAAVAAAVMAWRKLVRHAYRLVGALLVEITGFLTTNYAVARPRPHVVRVGSTPSTFSWPSGHTAATLVLYAGIALAVTAATRRWWARGLAWAVAASMVVCVALSRVYRGEHHVTDVLAGAALGVAALAVAGLAVRRWQQR